MRISVLAILFFFISAICALPAHTKSGNGEDLILVKRLLKGGMQSLASYKASSSSGISKSPHFKLLETQWEKNRGDLVEGELLPESTGMYRLNSIPSDVTCDGCNSVAIQQIVTTSADSRRKAVNAINKPGGSVLTWAGYGGYNGKTFYVITKLS